MTLRVAIVAPSLQHMYGGQEVQGEQLLSGWKDSEAVQVELVESNPALTGILRHAERVPVVRTLLRLPKRFIQFSRVLIRVDIVHVFSGSHSSFVVGSLPAILAGWLLRKPVLVHYHSPRAEAHLVHSSLARHVFRRCDAVVVPSPYLQEVFGRHGIATRIIPNVVDSARFKWRTEPRRPNTVLCARNFEHRYGVDDVIRAFAKVKRVLPNAALLLAGSGPEALNLAALVKTLGLTEVTFAGAVPRDRLASLMESSAVMINASREDNMPLTLLEAFACGLPVATTSAGGISTFVRHRRNALVAEPGNIDALAQHVVALLVDSSVAERLAANARLDATQYTWHAVGPSWGAIYCELKPKS
ncbi:MAG: glycosyltransferase family 4 protein [Gemmatimonadaceae bacterium]